MPPISGPSGAPYSRRRAAGRGWKVRRLSKSGAIQKLSAMLPTSPRGTSAGGSGRIESRRAATTSSLARHGTGTGSTEQPFGKSEPVAAEVASGRLGDGAVALEPHAFLPPGEVHDAGRTAAVLGDDDLRLARAVGRIVGFGPMQKEDQVGVLLDGAALAEVGQPRPLLFAQLDAAVELGQRDHRHEQLLGELLQPARDLRDLLFARGTAVFRLDQLQVVDDHQADLVLPLEPAGDCG